MSLCPNQIGNKTDSPFPCQFIKHREVGSKVIIELRVKPDGEHWLVVTGTVRFSGQESTRAEVHLGRRPRSRVREVEQLRDRCERLASRIGGGACDVVGCGAGCEAREREGQFGPGGVERDGSPCEGGGAEGDGDGELCG